MKRLALILLLPVLLGARLFDDATPDYMQADTAAFTAAGVTIAGWVNPDDFPGGDTTFFWNGDKDDPSESWVLQLESSGDVVAIRALAAGSGTQANSTTGFTLDVWSHVAGTEVATDDRNAFIDGGSKGSNTSSRSPAGADRTAIGMSRDSTPSRAFSGSIAHVAIWNGILTDGELASLGAGFPPRRVRPDILIHYWPLNGSGGGAEVDIIGGLNLTITGSPTVVEEPPNLHAPMVAP